MLVGVPLPLRLLNEDKLTAPCSSADDGPLRAMLETDIHFFLRHGCGCVEVHIGELRLGFRDEHGPAARDDSKSGEPPAC